MFILNFHTLLDFTNYKLDFYHLNIRHFTIPFFMYSHIRDNDKHNKKRTIKFDGQIKSKKLKTQAVED